MNAIKPENTCIRCHKPFVCGIASGKKTCWCMENPVHLAVPESGTGCFCPACLADEVRARKSSPQG